MIKSFLISFSLGMCAVFCLATYPSIERQEQARNSIVERSTAMQRQLWLNSLDACEDEIKCLEIQNNEELIK